MKTLEKIEIEGNNLESVPPDSLAEAVVGLREVDLTTEMTHLTGEQCQVLMDAIRTAVEKTLEKLEIQSNSLETVSPNSLAEAVIGIREVNLRNTHLTREQCQVLSTSIISSEKRNLKILEIQNTDFGAAIDKAALEQVRQMITLKI